MAKVLVTGASGFIGKALCLALAKQADVYAVVRQLNDGDTIEGVRQIQIASIDGDTDWSAALQGIDVVIHLAARVHVLNDTAADPLAAFRKTNVDGTVNLAKQAKQAGVMRFVFLSSIKVNGEVTESGKPFTPEDSPNPSDAYGQSKLEAEQALLAFSANQAMSVVIIRPPLVYGPGVKANFLALIRILNQRMPLPFAAVHNRRSLVALDNLVDLITACCWHPAAANQIFLVSDGDDLSTTRLLREISHALAKPALLLAVPTKWLLLIAKLLGKQAVLSRLCGNLQVDISKTRQLLAWQPPFSVGQGIQKTVQHYLNSCK